MKTSILALALAAATLLLSGCLEEKHHPGDGHDHSHHEGDGHQH